MTGERLVLCGGAPPPAGAAKEALRLNLDGPGQNITVRLQDITRRMAADLPGILIDLLEVAAYVYGADWGTRRGGSMHRLLGKDWRRRFHFVIPVRNPEVWNSADVIEPLIDTLGFLSEDHYQFDFVDRPADDTYQRYFQFGDGPQKQFEPDEIMLFSGGLDSLAGAADEVLGKGRSVALVSHHSATKIVKRQKGLVAELKKLAPGRVFHVPVKVDKKGKLEHEFTLRSRSFLFASLAVVVARMFNKSDVRFFENGVVSLNLPILPQVVGARATRSTHPKALAGFGEIFSALFGKAIKIENPFALKTKADVVRLIENRRCGDLIRSTISCTRVRAITTYKTHCGTCSQCIDRRFGVLAADLEHRDPEEMYAVRLLEDERDEGEARTMIGGYVKLAVEIKNATDEAFFGRFAGELSRAMQHLPRTADDNARHLIDLHRRHAESVFSVLEQGVKRHAADLVAGSLPPHCLLTMAVARNGELALHAKEESQRPRIEPNAPIDEPVDHGRSSEIRIALDSVKRRILLQDLKPLTGRRTLQLFRALAEAYVRDRDAGRSPDNYEYLNAKELAKGLCVEEASLRRLVSRIRRAIFTDFQRRIGMPLSHNAVIDSRSWRGYRLNPDVRILDPAEIAE